MSIRVRYYRPTTLGVDAEGWIAIVSLRSGEVVPVHCYKFSDGAGPEWVARAIPDEDALFLPPPVEPGVPVDPSVVIDDVRKNAVIAAALKSEVAA